MSNAIVLDAEKNIRFELIRTESIEANPWNANLLSNKLFDKLSRELETTGFIQPIHVVPTEDGKYRIIDGEQRYTAAKLLDMRQIPCIVSENDRLVSNEDQQKFATMVANNLRGKWDKRKLREMIEDLATRFTLDELTENMAFEDEDYLAELILDARASLPSEEMKREFDKAREEIQTVDDLSALLNRLFTHYGETLEYGYMVLDYGGKDHLWVRLNTKQDFQRARQAAQFVREYGYTFSSALIALFDMLDERFLEERADILEVVKEHEEEHTVTGGTA